jgi:hypothetical protein
MSYYFSRSWWGIDVHVLGILEAVPKIAKKRMVEMFQHPPLSDDVAHAL